MQALKRVPHPSGVSIHFDSKWHQYKMGNTKLQSVSKLLDKYFPFDEERILAVVAKKKQLPTTVVKEQWNRQALLGKNVHEYIECKLLDKPPPTFVLLMEKQKRDAARRGAAATAGDDGNDEQSKEKKAAEARLMLELLHGEEALYLPIADAAVERVKSAYEVVGVEQVVAAPDWGLAGTIDFIGVNKRDPTRILIGDWKTSGSVNSNFRFGSFETPSESCLRHLPNTKFYRYAMQVIVYGEIIKKEKYIEKGFFDSMLTAALSRIQREGKGEGAAAASTQTDGDDGAANTGSGKKAKKKGSTKSAAAATPSTSLQERLNAIHGGDFVLEYGIVQLSKDEEGGVEAEFKRVSEGTVLPPDTPEMNFRTLLSKVMAGG